MTQLVSVIIPIYKVEDYINKSIQSVVSQTLKDIEIILVDDGSPDGCPQIADEWSKKDSRVRVVHKKNAGVTAARNDGLTLAQGKYIFFLDGDDYIEPDTLEVMHGKAELTDADWVIGDFVIECVDGTSYDKTFPDIGVSNNIQFLRYCYSNRDFYYTGRLIRREFLVDAKLSIPEDITYGEDNLAVTQLASQLKVAVGVRQRTLHYVQRAQSVTNKLSTNDLTKRARACVMCYDFLKKKPYFEDIEQSVSSFYNDEYFTMVSHGVKDADFMTIYKESRNKSDKRSSLPKRLLCNVSLVNFKFASGICALSHKILNLLRQ